MRVSRAQAEENRRTVIQVAARLFRERGFDGIGLNDLMKGAGLTQGGFYKQFRSKEDLAAQASAKAFEGSAGKWADVAAKARKPLDALVRFYLSDRHRQEKGERCALAALGADAARGSPALRQAFEEGIERQLAFLDGLVDVAPGKDVRERSMAVLSTKIGALVLSRAVNDEQLSKQFLQAATASVLKGSTRGEAQQGPRR
ncbi:MAG: TetR family transcriptional regulator [Rhizobiaceae bacterium]|nr:MAG: TetR family transcriptional regulator [Rhizobiaceae bacterium]CAG1006752.1 HTH-type transcriptional regulator AcrR [Rhizobiaceae bacterium]